MTNGCTLRRFYRFQKLIMIGLTISLSTCLYVFGLTILSSVTPTQQRSSYIGLNVDVKINAGSNQRDTWYIEGDPSTRIGRPVEYEAKNKTRRLPQAIIIGVKKAGTRALLEFLRLHPNVKAPGPEPHFFDKNYDKGLNYYRSLMPETYKDQLTIEKTPSYFVTKGIPERVYKMSKHMKLVVVFRDPVTRALSDYAQLSSRNPTVKSFEQMLYRKNLTKDIDTSWTIVKIGLYAQHLARWLDYFPLHQIHFVSGENLIENPANEIEKVQEFLGLEQYITADNFTFNQTKGFPCYKRDRLKPSWHCLNDDKGRKHPDISPETMKLLQDFYRPFNYKLYSMTGRNFGWS